MKYFLIAGEASGDLHGSNLMEAIRKQDPGAEFACWGGDLMQAKGGDLLKHYRETSFMGFWEVITHLRSISAHLSICKKQIKAFNPDVVILIDYPGFNLRIARFCKETGIRVVYYIAPKVWAWKEKRVHQLEKYVDLLLLIFPFEVAYFSQWKVKAVYCGNPLQDALGKVTPLSPEHFNFSNDKRPLIALLPGSRKQEIKRMLPVMLRIVNRFPAYRFVIAGAPGIDAGFYQPYLSPSVDLVFHQTYALVKQSEAALVCSGTATLETALLGIPQVCGYAGNALSYMIAKLVVKIQYISLVNLCLNRPAIRELIQQDFNEDNLALELGKILPGGEDRGRMLKDYEELAELIGGAGASDQAASTILAGYSKG